MTNIRRFIRCVIADDHEFFRLGLVKVLQTMDIEVVGEAADGEALVALVNKHNPDLAIVDIKMPRMNGIDAAKIINDSHPDCAIIALTVYIDEHLIVKMLQAGARSFLDKETTGPELERAIMTVVDKKQYYFPQPDILNIFEMMQQGKLPEPVISFSNQETEIIQLICKGLSNQKIADQLFLSKRTIESHRSRIFEKVGVSNAAGLVAFAFSNGIIKKLA